MRGGRRLELAIAIATTAHVVAVAALNARSVVKPPESVHRGSSNDTEIEVTREIAHDERHALTGAPRPMLADRGTPRASVVGGHPSALPRVIEATPSTSEESTGWAFSPLATTSNHVDGAALTAATRVGVGDVVSQWSKEDEASVYRDRLALHDSTYLAGAAGVLVPLTREIVRGSLVPTPSSARLAVQIDAAGVVASVSVIDASLERNTWDDVANVVRDEARKRRIPVPHGARGVALTLDVVSYLASPSGVAGPDEVTTYSPLEERFDQAELHRAARAASPRAPQPRRLDLVIGPTLIDLTIHQGLEDAVRDATQAARKTVAVNVVEERAL